MKIGILGSGNLADVLTREFSVHNCYSVLNFGRNKEEVLTICSKYDTHPITSYDEMSEMADIILICVSDDAIEEVSLKLSPNSKAIVAHTSGSKSMDVMKSIPVERRGILYPLQTFRKDHKADFTMIPICLNYISLEAGSAIEKVAFSLSDKIIKLDDADRLKTHLGAVVMNNFINHLAVKTKDFFEREGLSYDLLLPLIQETFYKIGKQPLDLTQTGPARRGDLGVIRDHLHLIKDDRHFSKIYQAISKSIEDNPPKK